MLGESDHRHPGPERLDGEHKLRAQRIGEARQVTRNIAARHVDKVEALEHGPAEYAYGGAPERGPPIARVQLDRTGSRANASDGLGVQREGLPPG